jgi:hypothetical protein
MKVPNWVHENAKELAEEKDMTMKEAVAYMCRNGGFGA